MGINNRVLLDIIATLADKYNLEIKYQYKKTWKDYLCGKCRSNNNDDFTKLVSEVILYNLTIQQRETLAQIIINVLPTLPLSPFQKANIEFVLPLIMESRIIQIYLLQTVIKFLREELNLIIVNNH